MDIPNNPIDDHHEAAGEWLPEDAASDRDIAISNAIPPSSRSVTPDRHLPKKSVQFVSPVKIQQPPRYYQDLAESEEPAPSPTPNLHHPPSRGNGNIDSDFLLHTRKRSTDHPIDKIKKRTSIFSMHRPASIGSLSGLGGFDNLLELQRSASSGSAKSLTDRLSFLRIPHANKSPENSHHGPVLLSGSTDLSGLPADRSALEGRINYHISRLDRLKRRLTELNHAVQQEYQEYSLQAANLRAQGMNAAVEDLANQLQWLRRSRDGLRPSVQFHRNELDRMAQKRRQMDEENGYEFRLPEIYAKLDGDEVWQARFSV
jgi:hypothetical protein